MRFYRSFQALPPTERRKCHACPGSQNRTPKNTASAAYGSCAALSPLSPRFDGGIGHTDIARWTADICDGSHISGKYTRSSSAAMSYSWHCVSLENRFRNVPSGRPFFFAMTLFPAFQYHGTILSCAMFHNPGLFSAELKG